jgi:hypothetical protein
MFEQAVEEKRREIVKAMAALGRRLESDLRWSLLKRSIVGSYHHLSVRHLPAYLKETEFRFNNRDNRYLFRDTLMKLVQAETLSYADLIA